VLAIQKTKQIIKDWSHTWVNARYAANRTKKIMKGSSPASLVCIISATILPIKMRHNPQNKLLRGFFLNSRFAILKPNLSKTRSMIRVTIPAFRYGTRLSRNLEESSTIVDISTDYLCADMVC
jgi:hypothetical protein